MIRSDWEKGIDQFSKKAKKCGDSAMRAISADAANELIIGSAVDIGRFRKNWVAKLNSPSSRAVTWTGQKGVKFRSPVTGTEKRNLAAIFRAKLRDTVFITNNIVYAKKLESGTHSTMMPFGILFITAKRIEDRWRRRKFNVESRVKETQL